MKVLLVTLALAACPLTSVTAQDYAAAIGFGGPLRVYEVGDNTDRALIRSVARTSAEEMMRLLLGELESESPLPEHETEPQLIPKSAAFWSPAHDPTARLDDHKHPLTSFRTK